MEYVVHLNYGPLQRVWNYDAGNYILVGTHMVRCPNGEAKLFLGPELADFLTGKAWRLAR